MASLVPPEIEDRWKRCCDGSRRFHLAKWLITIGIVLVVLGVLWPLLAKVGLGSLPGDIKLERKGYTFYFPLTTSIIVSAVITLILWIFRK
jgi:prepilin signal peptidase PulO-like enzyme (type II secretory pathway)